MVDNVRHGTNAGWHTGCKCDPCREAVLDRELAPGVVLRELDQAREAVFAQGDPAVLEVNVPTVQTRHRNMLSLTLTLAERSLRRFGAPSRADISHPAQPREQARYSLTLRREILLFSRWSGSSAMQMTRRSPCRQFERSGVASL